MSIATVSDLRAALRQLRGTRTSLTLALTTSTTSARRALIEAARGTVNAHIRLLSGLMCDEIEDLPWAEERPGGVS